MSDNELDNLFKEAAEGFKVPHDPSAWKDMSGKLDQDGTGGTFWNWKSTTITSLFIVGGLALIWYWSGSIESGVAGTQTLVESVKSTEVTADKSRDAITAQPKQLEEAGDKVNRGVGNDIKSSGDKSSKTGYEKRMAPDYLVQTEVTSPSEEKQTEEVNQNKKTNNLIKSQVVATEPVKKSEVTTANVMKTEGSNLAVQQKQAVKTTNETSRESKIENAEKKHVVANGLSGGGYVITQQAPNPANVVNEEKSATVSNQKLKDNEKQTYAEGLAREVSSNNQDHQLDNVQGYKSDIPVASEGKALLADENLSKNTADSLNKVEEEKVVATDSAQVRSKKKKNKENRVKVDKILSIKLATAPDYTSVEDVSPKGWGISYGMLLEYQFRPHWSVATGAIWSKKIYSAEDVKYNGYTADWVDGDCRMWDIPVNVYYHFTPGRKLSFYGGAGLSSYLMNEENYTFYYETSHGVYDYNRQIKGENNEWFKTLNISLGMQYRISNRFSLQLEPILKAPLAGVGEGEVSLVSLGAFFNLRYNFLIKNR